jgi:Sigma-70, region 4
LEESLKKNNRLKILNKDSSNLDKIDNARSHTLSRKQLTQEHRRMKSQGELLHVVDSWHPASREDCHRMSRPCLYVSCRHHLYLDVNPQTGSVKFNFPDKEVWELEETCALDVAERGGSTLEEVGQIMNLTRERIRQIEIRSLQKIEASGEEGATFQSFALEDLSES